MTIEPTSEEQLDRIMHNAHQSLEAMGGVLTRLTPDEQIALEPGFMFIATNRLGEHSSMRVDQFASSSLTMTRMIVALIDECISQIAENGRLRPSKDLLLLYTQLAGAKEVLAKWWPWTVSEKHETQYLRTEGQGGKIFEEFIKGVARPAKTLEELMHSLGVTPRVSRDTDTNKPGEADGSDKTP